MKNYVLLLLLLVHATSFACDCPWIEDQKTRIEKHFKSSEVVFIGRAAFNQPDSSFLTITVLEVFKGEVELNETLISSVYSRDNCDVTIFTEGKWLVYGHFENDTLRLNSCSLSSSFEYPNIPPPPPLPPPDIDKNDKVIFNKGPKTTLATLDYFSDENLEKEREKAKKRLDKEVKYLRKLKAKADKK